MSSDERVMRLCANIGHVYATIWFGGGGLVFVQHGYWMGWLLVGFMILSWPIEALVDASWRAKGYTWENAPKRRQNITMQAFFAVFTTVATVFMALVYFKVIQ